MSLSCGGRGPCCHVGYAHRHCEHCDYVIPLHQHQHTWPWTQPWFNSGASYGLYGQTSGGLTALARSTMQQHEGHHLR